MGKSQKKFGKGRLDKYYKLAKEKGYRARSSFKIIQINEKFGGFLQKSRVVLDLCAAPGSWCQVAAQVCPLKSLIVGVDLAPIKPLPNVITFQSDITTEHCRQQLRGHLKTWKADTVMHDGAPNVGLAWKQDAFTQSELVLQSLKLAVEFLTPGGTFVTKIFRSKDYNNLMWVFNQFFDKVQATKPAASRDVSAEIFVVCSGFKAPKKIDPRLLESKYVFEELQDSGPNYNARVFNPEKHTRKRDGYEEDDYLQFKRITALEFLEHSDPIQCLGSYNEITLDFKEQPELKPLRKLPETTDELKECFKDLKVLGKKDFRTILKWRKIARATLGFGEELSTGHKKNKGDGEQEEEVEVKPLTEEEKEEQITKDLQALQEKESAKKKREKRRANEQKQKEIQRMQMNMTTPQDIGFEASQNHSLFNLKHAEKSGELSKLQKGKKSMVFDREDHLKDEFGGDDFDPNLVKEYDSDEAIEDLGDQLDTMYEAYKERQAERESHYAAKRAREKDGDDEFVGFSDREQSDDDTAVEEQDDDSDDDSSEDEALDKLVTTLETQKKGKLSAKAAMFFDDPIFGAVEQDDDPKKPVKEQEGDDEDQVMEEVPNGKSATNGNGKQQQQQQQESEEEEESDDDFEVVANEQDSDDDWDTSNEKERAPYVDLVTEQAMTMAHQLALGHKTKKELEDEGFNRYSFRDKDGLPDWFLDDENKHSKISKPITKEAAAAIKEKQREMNARPMKKVAEAKARKKQKALRRLEKLRKKSETINEDSSRSEAEKSEEIAKLTQKLTKKDTERPKLTVVAARGANRGLQGRPMGVKGRYKMVDGRMKKEQRALKRIAKKKK
jgi:AdoMet-dependent rRNA methyltransferase SPB1